MNALDWWTRRLELRRQTERIGRAGTRSYVPDMRQTFESDQPWIVYTFGRTHDAWRPVLRSTRLLGRAAIGMECAICGEQRVVLARIPRYGAVPDRGRHPERARFCLEHIHPDRPHLMAWKRPLLNAMAHGTAGVDLDLLTMRLEADLQDTEDEMTLKQALRSHSQLSLDAEVAHEGHGGSITARDGGWAWTAHRGHERRSGWALDRTVAQLQQRAATRQLYGLDA